MIRLSAIGGKVEKIARYLGVSCASGQKFYTSLAKICIKYLDESGFSLWSEPVYTWAKIGQQKRIEQTKKKGKRLNICGLLEPDRSFEYGLFLKNFNSDSYIKLMNWQAYLAEQRLS